MIGSTVIVDQSSTRRNAPWFGEFRDEMVNTLNHVESSSLNIDLM